VAAREEYAKKNATVRYIDVKHDADGMQQMLEASNGRREVPVIVDGGKVTIGYGGT
jgi:glutaredoxin